MVPRCRVPISADRRMSCPCRFPARDEFAHNGKAGFNRDMRRQTVSWWERTQLRRPLWRSAQVVVLLLIAAFWARTLYIRWPHLRAYPWRVAWPTLVLALLALLGQMLVLATAWQRALCLVGAEISWREGAGMWLRAQIARYLPGGVWDVAGRVWLSRAMEMPTRAVPAAAMLEIGLQILSSGSVLVITLALIPGPHLHPYIFLIPVVLVLTMGALAPPVFHGLVNRGLALLGRPPLEMRVTYGGLATLLGFYIFAHFLQGVGFVLFTRGIALVGWDVAFHMVGAYIGAWLVGYMVVFAPTGIGVREAALVLLLGNVLAPPVVIGAALGFRVWLSLRDVLAAGVGVVLTRGEGVVG